MSKRTISQMGREELMAAKQQLLECLEKPKDFTNLEILRIGFFILLIRIELRERNLRELRSI